MDPWAGWNDLARKKPFFRFADTLAKGYAQVLFCLHPGTGLFLAGAIFYISPAIGSLTLLGVVYSTLTAFLVRARALHIDSGVYGFNGVVLGVAWGWFFKLKPASVVLLILAAILSSLLMKFLSGLSARTRTNVPVFSLPSLLLIWSLLLGLHTFFPRTDLLGPDQRMEEYFQDFQNHFLALRNYFTGWMFFSTFQRHLVAIALILFGVYLHSWISAGAAGISFLLTLAMILGLGGIGEIVNIEFYLYNTIPCAIALGGIFLVLNRRAVALTVLGVVLVGLLTFAGIKYFPFPAFVAPFNFITILLIAGVKAGTFARKYGLHAVPMELISTPQMGIQWYQGERYAVRFWQEISNPSAKIIGRKG